MPYDRFLIAPMNSGLQTNLLFKASYGIFLKNTKGCIMNKRRSDSIDITGQRFGDLVAIKPLQKGKYRGITWLCKCDCGNETIAFGGHLRANMRKSCGCRSEKRITETGINLVYSIYKRMAKKRSWPFSLSRNKVKELILSNCSYCGIEPNNELKRQKSNKMQLKYTGIDRFDTNKGYTEENSVSCCYYCNHAKADLSYDEWINHLKRIYSYQGISNGI